MQALKLELEQIILSDKKTGIILQDVCDLLKSSLELYNWVGFYFVNGDKKELKLAQFSGKPTNHLIIPFGKGICGQVAISNENFVVPNVEEESNYISCGIEVKSEIVIPIFKDGKNIGQIDIDSHSVNSFTEKDTELLEFICELIGEKL